jgi:hypothetical protein
MLGAKKIPNDRKVMSVRINYRRESDLKNQSVCSFFYFSREEKWVAENDNSLKPEIYNPIKGAVLKRSNVKFDYIIDIDPLHMMEEV